MYASDCSVIVNAADWLFFCFSFSFECKLQEIFKDIHDAYERIEGRLKAEQFKVMCYVLVNHEPVGFTLPVFLKIVSNNQDNFIHYNSNLCSLKQPFIWELFRA